MDIVVFHNPQCGTSKNVLEIIQQTGHTPVVMPYLKQGWTRPLLLTLFAAAGMTPRQAMREKGSPAEELGLLKPDATDEAILVAMTQHPVLVNRPFVVTPKGVRLCRPAEAVRALL